MAVILIVDDDPVFAEMASQRLARAGHVAQVHIGPFGATVAALAPEIDLVILDVFMPGLGGPDLLQLLRRSIRGARRAVIFCSSMDARPLATLAAEQGADGSVSKSAGREEFLSCVRSTLARRKLSEA